MNWQRTNLVLLWDPFPATATEGMFRHKGLLFFDASTYSLAAFIYQVPLTTLTDSKNDSNDLNLLTN